MKTKIFVSIALLLAAGLSCVFIVNLDAATDPGVLWQNILFIAVLLVAGAVLYFASQIVIRFFRAS